MEELGSPRFEGMGNTIRRKRSQTSRRPKLEASPVCDESTLSTPPSDDVSKVSSDENMGGDTNSRIKEFSLNQCVLRDSSGVSRRYSEGALAPANWNSTGKIISSSEVSTGDNGNAVGVDNRVKKVKLKVGGVMRTIQTKSTLAASGSESSFKGSRNSDASRSQYKLSHQEDSNGNHSSLDKKIGLRGIPWKDFTITDSSSGNGDFLRGKMTEKNGIEPSRKSKRVPKKRVLDSASEDDEDAEIKYLEKMKNAKVAILNRHLEEESSKKNILISGLSKKTKRDEISDDSLSSMLGRDGNKSSRSERGSEDTDYEEEEEIISEGEPESKKIKKSGKDFVDSTMEIKSEPVLTTRQRARLSGKDAFLGSTGIEFPNGLPPAPRKQKEKLTEVEQQLKKAEAAQRRRLQVEKAARESEAEAIRKILGQDSSRKKREDKNKKRQEELEQEKAANALKLASSTVRWVMGPTGTVVTFPTEMGLPSIFNPSTRSYPPPREKCAGPSCNNSYKYRDSKTKIPLCSLHCYKAVQVTDNGTSISPLP